MIDFKPLRNKETTIHELCGHLTPADLRNLTHEMVDKMLDLIADCTDEDVTFVPEDPEAYDRYAATEAEINIAWTLGHVIVHVTASAEEAAFLAAELARGVKREGRSRSELYWEKVKTIDQCRKRLEESRRQRLASLEMWPDEPYLDNTTTVSYLEGPINPPARFVLGLRHDDSHLGQLVEIIRQAKAARTQSSAA
jgi:hypothetical protein